MKIGFNNILLTLWFVLILACDIGFIYFTFFTGHIAGTNMLLPKVIIMLMVLMCSAIVLYMLAKFRLLVITNKQVIFIYPFLFKTKKFEIASINQTKWELTIFKSTVYRTLTITGANRDSISISDFEFENFNGIAASLPCLGQDIVKQKTDYKQAKANVGMANFMLLASLLFVCFMLYKNIVHGPFHPIDSGFYAVAAIVLFAATKRRLWYNTVIRQQATFNEI